MKKLTDTEVATLLDEAFRIGMMQIRGEIEDLVRHLQQERLTGRNLLEIGCANGGTTHVWSRLCKHVTTICYEPYGAFGASLGEAALAARNARLHGYGNVRLIHGNSHKLATLCAAAESGPYDILFLDGDHTLLGVSLDFWAYIRLVKPGGLVVLHDIKNHGAAHACQVSEFWKGLSGDRHEYSSSVGQDARWGGIGVLTVPDHGSNALLQHSTPGKTGGRSRSNRSPATGGKERPEPALL